MSLRYLGLLACIALSGAEGAHAARPNVIFIMVDDLGYGDLGVFGADHVATPRLDALAAEGVRLTQMYSSAVCSPSRVRLLTGRSPQRLGFRRQLNEATSARGLPSQTFTMAEMFSDAGYRTAHFGKWHLGRNTEEHLPFSHGFDEGAFRLDFLYNDPSFQMEDGSVTTQLGHSTEILTEFALEYVDEHAEGDPFFLSLWFWAPHRSSSEPDKTTAYFPPDDWASQYEDTEWGRRAAQIAHLDEQLGRLFDELVRLGIDQNTLVVFGSDNGAVDLGGSEDPNGDFQGFKGQLHEGGIRVPFIMHWPGKISPDWVYDNILVLEDFMPTFGELLDHDLSQRGLDGRSFYRALRGDFPAVRPDRLFWEYRPGGARADEEGELLNDYAVRNRRWKLIVSADPEDRSLVTEALYKVETDPEESRNLADRNIEIVEELKLSYSEWRRETLSIPFAVDSLRGGVAQAQGQLTFSEPGQALLDRNSVFEISDGDFTFTAVIELDPLTLDGVTSEIAYKKESWRLNVNTNGHLRLEFDGTAGELVRLESQTPLLSNQPLRVSFTVATWKNHPSLFRLYVDDQLEDEVSAEVQVQSSDAVIRLGSRGTGFDKPFFGSVDKLRFYATTLQEDELLALDAPSP